MGRPPPPPPPVTDVATETGKQTLAVDGTSPPLLSGMVCSAAFLLILSVVQWRWEQHAAVIDDKGRACKMYAGMHACTYVRVR